MPIHTTNYISTFIGAAEDCPVIYAEIPVINSDKPTIAAIHFGILNGNPYKFTSDDVIFQTFAIKNELADSEIDSARELFFSKGQACMRCSPLTKKFGFGIHADADSKIAIYAVDSNEYQVFMANKSLKIVKAMRNKAKPS